LGLGGAGIEDDRHAGGLERFLQARGAQKIQQGGDRDDVE
jgi:hypothetical protein